MVIIASSLLLAGALVLLLGLVTLGIGWGLFFLLAPPAWLVWAILYCGVTLGGPRSATLGMRLMDLEMRTYYGAPAYFVLGAVHAVFFWLSVSALTPFVLLVCFFNERRRLLHDILLGTVIVNDARRARHAARRDGRRRYLQRPLTEDAARAMLAPSEAM